MCIRGFLVSPHSLCCVRIAWAVSSKNYCNCVFFLNDQAKLRIILQKLFFKLVIVKTVRMASVIKEPYDG